MYNTRSSAKRLATVATHRNFCNGSAARTSLSHVPRSSLPSVPQNTISNSGRSAEKRTKPGNTSITKDPKTNTCSPAGASRVASSPASKVSSPLRGAPHTDIKTLMARIQKIESQNSALVKQIEDLTHAISSLKSAPVVSLPVPSNDTATQYLTERVQNIEQVNQGFRKEIQELKSNIASLTAISSSGSLVSSATALSSQVNPPTYDVHFKRVFIFSDSMGRDLATNLGKCIDTGRTKIYSTVKPGASFHDVVKCIPTSGDFTKDDVIFIAAGTNDMSGAPPASSKLLSTSCLQTLATKSNIVLNSIPYRHDTHASLSTQIYETNKGLEHKIYSSKFSFFNVNQFLKRNHFTRHGVHLNKLGKSVFARNLALFFISLCNKAPITSPNCSFFNESSILNMSVVNDNLLSQSDIHNRSTKNVEVFSIPSLDVDSFPPLNSFNGGGTSIT